MSDYMVHLGRVAYNAYRQSCGHGDALPRFDDLPVGLSNAWIAAGSTVYARVKEVMAIHIAEVEKWCQEG